MKTTIAIALAAAFSLVGCKHNKPAASTGSAGSAEMAGSAGSAMAGSAGSADGSAGSAAMAGSGSSAALDLPTEEDFEAQAKTNITDKNLTTQVKALETDLGK